MRCGKRRLTLDPSNPAQAAVFAALADDSGEESAVTLLLGLGLSPIGAYETVLRQLFRLRAERGPLPMREESRHGGVLETLWYRLNARGRREIEALGVKLNKRADPEAERWRKHLAWLKRH
jgi:hypothetical protein